MPDSDPAPAAGPGAVAVSRRGSRTSVRESSRCISLGMNDANRMVTAVSSDPAKEMYRLLIETGSSLAREPDRGRILQITAERGRLLTGAALGVCLYTHANEGPDEHEKTRLDKGKGEGEDGAPPAGFSTSDPAVPAGFASVLAAMQLSLASGEAKDSKVSDDQLIHSADISTDHRFRSLHPSGDPSGGPEIRSYLAVPARDRSGRLLARLIFAAPAVDAFSVSTEFFAEALAQQTAAALESVHLAAELSHAPNASSGTAQQQPQSQQPQGRDRLRQFLDATTDSILLIDRDWHIAFANIRAAQLLGHGGDLTDKSFADAFPGPEGLQLQQQLAEVLRGGGALTLAVHLPALDLWANLRVDPTSEGLTIFLQDISGQHRAELLHQDTDRRLRLALDAGSLGTWSWNRATDALDFDERAAALFGVAPHQPITRTEMRDRVVATEDRDAVRERLRHSLESGQHYSAEYRIHAPGGGQNWVWSSGIPTPGENAGEGGNTREIGGMVGIVQDVTARKLQEAVLRQSEKLAATGRLAASIAHEINNPLEAVTNLIYLARTDPLTPPAVQRQLEIADDEVARVSQIAQQTLGFYRDTTRPAEIDMNDLLTRVVDLFSRKLQLKQLECRVDLDPHMRIFGLAGEMRQVFSNLLVNAIDASASGTIRVRGRHCRRSGCRGVSVLVSDQGAGIPHHIRPRLFSPFFTTKEALGTGLGLWVTRGIVEKHGGAVRFRSRTETPSGTVFRVFLPATSAVAGTSSGTATALLQ